MIIDKIVVLAVAIICVAYLSYTFVKKNHKLNILVIAFSVFCLGVYIAAYVYNMKLSLIVESIIMVFMILIPVICVILQFEGFRITEKFAKFNGNFKFRLKKYEGAIRDYLNVKKMDEKTLYRLAFSYYKIGDYSKANTTFEDYIQKCDDNEDIYEAFYYMGRCLEYLEEDELAIEKYKECLEIKPDYYEALEALSLIYSNLNDFEKAISIYDEILKYYPHMYEANFNKAIIYMNYRNFDEAMICYQKALDENGSLVSARYNIGQIAFLKGDYQKAIENFIIVKDDDNYKVRAEYYLAKAYSILKNIELAKDYLKKVMDTDESYIAQAREEVIFYDLRDYIEEYINEKLNKDDSGILSDSKERVIKQNKKKNKEKNKTGFINKFYRD